MLTFDIATATKSNLRDWTNKKTDWPSLSKRLSETMRTSESSAEYARMTKPEKAEAKKNGSFVAGYINDGRRSKTSIRHRSMITLDLDKATPNVWAIITKLYDFTTLIYSTHSHTPENPRIRLIIPLSNPVTPDEYGAISRKIAEQVGMSMFDPTTFQHERLMYWPSTPHDGVFYTENQNTYFLNPQTILSQYVDPLDITAWPQHPEGKKLIDHLADKQGDPGDKPGLIGAFCRAYDVYGAQEFIPGVYEQTTDDRMTYTAGSSASGAVIYQNGLFIYSHHGTDPIQETLCNAFDMVRIHKFGKKDADSKATTTASLPSSKAMMKFIATLPAVIKEAAIADFAPIEKEELEEQNNDWLSKLTVDRFGQTEQTIPNFELIIDNDPKLKNKFYYDEFEDRTFGQLPFPWEEGDRLRDLKDIDDSNLESYISRKYRIHHAANIKKAFDNVCFKYKKHPVRDYLDTLEWDKKSRIDTLLIDHLGATDNLYIRTVTRKALLACATRIYYPGTKFDNTLVIIGEEGLRKSTLLSLLGGKWFSDTFVGVTGVDSMQQLQGTWIMEMGELEGLNKADVTAIKSFLSRTMDKYRSSYGRRNNVHPRQTVFWGTTNISNFLRGDAGNRRFWPVEVYKKMAAIPDVDQVWAEAKHYCKLGETLDIPDEVHALAKEEQKKHGNSDERTGIIANYLEMPLPDNWDELSRHERRNYIFGDELLMARGANYRTKVCSAEIWVELFKREISDMTAYNTKSIHESMAAIPGWQKADNPLTFSIYGRQRAYIRIEEYKPLVKTIQHETEDIL
jgi:predicted P-loop ATPase